MNIKTVIAEARKLATPSTEESIAIELSTEIVLKKLNGALKQKRIKAKAVCGGSFAKGTWLPTHTDIDCFILFNYRKYKAESASLADILEPAIELAFTHYSRIHGSRDYFQANYDNYIFEFVPVLKIKKPSRALNITDMSPLHVSWVKKKTKKTKLQTQIRIAKQFFKAAGVYGAESYIRGFSGHVVEILVIKYGSFVKLARASQTWKPKVFIDPASHFNSKKKAMRRLNKAKLDSPILLIDPTQPERNCAAALGKEKFSRLISRFHSFLSKPSVGFFKEKKVTVDDLKKGSKDRKLIILTASPQYDKRDIAGAKLLKQFEKLTRQIGLNDFKILNKGWSWEGLNKNAIFWFYLNPEPLSATKRHYGPEMSSSKERVDGFISKYGIKARREKGRLYVILKREYRKASTLLKALLEEEDFSNVKFVK